MLRAVPSGGEGKEPPGRPVREKAYAWPRGVRPKGGLPLATR